MTLRALLTATAIPLLALGLFALAATNAGADGNDSPDACKTPYSDTSGPTFSWTAPPGWTITGVCIKSGNGAFGDLQHSGVITSNGNYGDFGCYRVSGFGTQTVTVTERFGFCHDISHIDVIKREDSTSTPTQTPTNTATSVPSSTPTSPTSTPTVTTPTTVPTVVPSPTPTASSSPTPSPTTPTVPVELAEWCVNGVLVLAPANNPPAGAVVTADGNACTPVTLPTASPEPVRQVQVVSPPVTGSGGLR